MAEIQKTNPANSGNKCVVWGCSHGYGRLRVWKTEECEIHHGKLHKDCSCPPPYSIHAFPKHPELEKLWLTAINRGLYYKPKPSTKVCSIHFVDGKPTASNPVPTLHLGQPRTFKPVKERSSYRCAVVGCTSSYRKIRKWNETKCELHQGLMRMRCPCVAPYKMHKFPMEETLKQQWAIAINREYKVTHRVCSLHFIDGRPTEQNPAPSINLKIVNEDCEEEQEHNATCVVAGCNNSDAKLRDLKTTECDIHPGFQHQDCLCPLPYSLHVFPKDDYRKRRWELAINMTAKKHSKVCSVHFIDGRPTKENPVPELFLRPVKKKGKNNKQCNSSNVSELGDDRLVKSNRSFTPFVGTVCSVRGCYNSYSKIRQWKLTDCDIHPGLIHMNCRCPLPYGMHRFPRNLAMRTKWEQAMNKDPAEYSRTARVCSVHFVGGSPSKQNPIPSLFLGCKKQTGKPETSNLPKKSSKKRKIAKLVEKLPVENDYESRNELSPIKIEEFVTDDLNESRSRWSKVRNNRNRCKLKNPPIKPDTVNRQVQYELEFEEDPLIDAIKLWRATKRS